MYLCLLLYVSMIYLRPGEILPSWAGFPFVEILALIAAGVAVLTFVREPRPWTWLPHDTCILGFWVAIVASNLTWGWFGGALLGFADFFKIVFYYFLMRFAVREPHHVRWLVILLVVLNVVQATFGVLQYHTGVGVGGLELHRDGRIRGVGIFNDPNDLALALIMVVPFLLIWIADRDVFAGLRVLALAALALILVAVQYTGSRGALVGLAALVIAFSLRRFGLLRGAPLAVAGLLALLAWGPGRTLGPEEEDSRRVMAASVQETVAGIDRVVPDDSSARGRIEAWSEGLTLLRAHPLFGVGYSRFTEFNELVAHNSFIHTFSELGLLGAFFGMGLAYWYFKGLRRRDADDDAPPSLTLALVLAGIGFFTMVSFLSRQYDLVLYTLLGLGACHAAIIQPADPERRIAMTWRDVRNIGLLTAGAIVVIKLVVTVLTLLTRP